jgi:uncharacterized protein YecE (DUF72 family)
MPASKPEPRSRAPEIRIGISGWTYAPWRETFFPKDLTQKKELAYASRQVRSIEINGTFYSLQRPSSFATWYEQTPPDFRFSVKGSRFITHLKRLGEVREPLANFLASGLLRLNEKLGPLLWQLPPSFKFDPERLTRFFKLLPRSTAAAVKLARQHDSRVASRAWTKIDEDRPLRHAIEVRHRSFEDPAFITLLREQGIALVVADTAGKWPYLEDVTADFVYVRLHGDQQLYVSGYTPEALDLWAKKIRAWAKGADAPDARLAGAPVQARVAARDVYVYFDNDVKTRAPFDAMSLAHRLGIGRKPEEAPPEHLISEEPRTVWPGFGKRARKKTSTAPKPKGEKRLHPATRSLRKPSRGK